MSYRKVHGEYILNKIKTDQELEELTQHFINRTNALIDSVPLADWMKKELKERQEQQFRKFKDAVYTAGHNDGKMDILAQIKTAQEEI